MWFIDLKVIHDKLDVKIKIITLFVDKTFLMRMGSGRIIRGKEIIGLTERNYILYNIKENGLTYWSAKSHPDKNAWQEIKLKM